MKIAYLTPEYPHPQLGHSAGIGSSIKNLAQTLAEKGHKITVFVYSQSQDAVFNDGKIEIHAIAHRKYNIGGFYLYRKYLQKYINKVILEKGIQLIEAPDWTGITAFMKFQIPLVIRMHGTDAYFCQLEGRHQKWKNYWFEQLALKKADELVSVSQFTANQTAQLFNIKKHIEVIPNFIDTELFKSINKEIAPFQLLYFGTLIRKKGVLQLATIFNQVVEKEPRATLVLLGNDVVDIQEKKSTLSLFQERLSKVAKTKVKHLSSVPYKQIKEYIAAANVVVLPSLAEAFPMTWLEAMAMEKAMVTSDIGWAKELMVDGQTGYMVSPYQHRYFAEKIIRLLQDQQLTKEMGGNARQQIGNHFSKEIIGDKNIAYYLSILKK
jgi:glycosyltransferase involved in cell wall biosynthesis